MGHAARGRGVAHLWSSWLDAIHMQGGDRIQLAAPVCYCCSVHQLDYVLGVATLCPSCYQVCGCHYAPMLLRKLEEQPLRIVGWH